MKDFRTLHSFSFERGYDSSEGSETAILRFAQNTHDYITGVNLDLGFVNLSL